VFLALLQVFFYSLAANAHSAAAHAATGEPPFFSRQRPKFAPKFRLRQRCA
jgi:hypothetical protein